MPAVEALYEVLKVLYEVLKVLYEVLKVLYEVLTPPTFIPCITALTK